jgi:hypothetical protein
MPSLGADPRREPKHPLARTMRPVGSGDASRSDERALARTIMFEKILQAVLGLVLLAILWQLVALRKDLTRQGNEFVSFRTQLAELQRTARAGAWGGKSPLPGGTPTGITGARATPPGRAPASSGILPAVEDFGELPGASDEARWKEQQEALDHLRTQLQELLNDVDTIGADVETIGTTVLGLQTGAQSIAADVTTLGQEVARISTAVERIAGENR